MDAAHARHAPSPSPESANSPPDVLADLRGRGSTLIAELRRLSDQLTNLQNLIDSRHLRKRPSITIRDPAIAQLPTAALSELLR